jgi:integrase
MTNANREKRSRGDGCLIPPRPGITKYWAAQVYDGNGKAVRRSLHPLTGELRKGVEDTPENRKNPSNWTNVTAANVRLDKLKAEVGAGRVAIGADPAQLRYSDLRELFLADYKTQGHRSLRTDSDGVEYVDCLPHLDKFFGYQQEGDLGARVASITIDRVDQFKAERKSAGASNATVNRSLAALRRMFKLAVEKGKLQIAPPIKMLPEADPRTGFIEIDQYEKLRAALPDYIKPILQIGFYTGMRLGEILNLKWTGVDLAENMIRLTPAECKNKDGRAIPMIDGLPEMFEGLRRKNPNAEYVFLGIHGEQISSFRRAWTKATEAAGMPGLLFHDMRRSAVRNFIRAGVERSVAMKITGHKTESVFERYNITSEDDVRNAAEKLVEHLDRQRNAAPKKRRLKVVR